MLHIKGDILAHLIVKALLSKLLNKCLFIIFTIRKNSKCLAACIVGGVMWSPIYAEQPLWYSILITILALLAIFKHRQNIVRLCKGTENRFAFTAKQRAARDAKRAQQETSK